MNADAGPPVFSIGAVLGDSDAENQAWKRAVNDVGKQVARLRDGVSSPLRLNVVFHVDGKLVPNEFTGVRTGTFRRADSHLMVQAAVPPGPADDRAAVLLDLLERAVDEAERFARDRGLAERLTALRDLVGTLRTS